VSSDFVSSGHFCEAIYPKFLHIAVQSQHKRRWSVFFTVVVYVVFDVVVVVVSVVVVEVLLLLVVVVVVILVLPCLCSQHTEQVIYFQL